MQYTIQKTLVFLVLLAVLFGACKKDEIPSIGEPASKLAGISDTWKLSKVYQYDENVANSDVKTYDITEYFITGPAPVITFESTGKTFTYDPSDAPNFLGTSGSWRFDNDEFPSLIIATDAVGGEVEWQLLGPTRPVDKQLKIAVKRGCVSDATYLYLFVFDRQ